MTMTQVTYPTAPAITRRKGTLLDVAEVDSNFEWQDGEGLFESFNCLTFGAQPVFCGTNTKTLDQTPNWVDGVRFGAYGGMTCRTVGLDVAKAEREAEAAFLAGESIAVEAGVMEYLFVENDNTATLPGEWAAPVDLTPAGGAVSPALGLALLEGYAPAHYTGEPVLHLPRSVAALLSQSEALVFDGNALRTKLGASVAAGGGYDDPNTGPTGAAAAAGEKWLYATGGVKVSRSETIVRSTLAHEANDAVLLIERGYVVAYDCFAAAIRVTM